LPPPNKEKKAEVTEREVKEMRKLIAILAAFVFIASTGAAMAGQSEIGVKTYSEYGGVDAVTQIMPKYMADHQFFYQSDVQIDDCGKNVGTYTYTLVPADPASPEETAATVFFQAIEADEVSGHDSHGQDVNTEGHHGPDATFSDVLTVKDLASDAGQSDDAYHSLSLEVNNEGHPYHDSWVTVSKDMSVATGWKTDGVTMLAMTQNIYVDDLLDGHSDASGCLESVNTYGGDYYFDTSMWGTGMDYEFNWLIGTPS
jgi:hypothetical protein